MHRRKKKGMRVILLHVLQLLVFVSLSEAFVPATGRIHSGRLGDRALRAVPASDSDRDGARKALEQASRLRQEAADLEEELAKGL